jgi:two-component system phosphate regulon sensor histidine kinase PhoR
MVRKRLLWQIYSAFLLVTLISLVAATCYISGAWQELYLKQLALSLETQAKLVELQILNRLVEGNLGEIEKLTRAYGQETDSRFTIILPNGKVIGDSVEEPAQMDNHGDRPEIQAAINGRVGMSTRQSYTRSTPMMYVAVPMQHRGKVVGIVRTSIPVTAIDQTLKAIYLKVILAGLIIALLVAMGSLALSRRLSRPLEEIKKGAQHFARGELNVKLLVPPSDELGSVAEALNQMAAQLDERIRTILTQRHEQEAILASMVEGVLAVDNNDRLITLNKAGARLLGIESVTLQNQTIQEVIRNKDLQNFLAQARNTLQPIEGEIVLHTKGERFIQAHGTTLIDSQGKAIGVLIVLNDVTKMHHLERVRREFVANVSHELRTPITSIKGFVETLLAGAMHEPENAVNFLNIIARQANRLNQIIEDILSLSRIEQDEEQGKITLTRDNIKKVLQSAIQTCATKAEAKDIVLSLTCPDDLQAPINARLLEEALVNLIDNAINYSQPQTQVGVEAEPTDNKVTIRVKDQGRGIAKEHLPRLFERFYRGDPSRNRKVGGTGLGLAIVKHIVQAHGGRVTVESAPGQGSTFSLHLSRV